MSLRRCSYLLPTSPTKIVSLVYHISNPLSSYCGIKGSVIVQNGLGYLQYISIQLRQASTKPLTASNQVSSIPTEVRGETGRVYKIESILQDKGPLLGRVFLARGANRKYILKEIPSNNYRIRKEIYDRLGTNPHIRGLADTAPEHSMFIFDHVQHHFLGLVQRHLSLITTKTILKQALLGLAVMHAKDIVHNDIKPNNIFVEASEGPNGLAIEHTILADFEDSAHCPPPGNLVGAQLGNWMWRSPEAHAEGPMNKPSDIFAFAIVCIYAITKRMIFYVSQDELAEGEELLAIVIERQLSYFGESDMFVGFMEHLATANPENPWLEVFDVIRNGFSAKTPREPFAMWVEDPPFDNQFRDLILKMTCLDPKRRITAREALEHDWFKDV